MPLPSLSSGRRPKTHHPTSPTNTSPPPRRRTQATGLEHRTPYALRHTYASLSIAAGVSLFELSRLMGTSPAMLDKTYGHMLPDALDRARTALDAFVLTRGTEAAASDGSR